ncbi:MAG TPA: transporter, partial [Armatimonadota bacterium]|nr:transporter [Armatimonadota bacterium]
TSAGKVFMEVFRNYGWNMIGAGAVITTVSVVFALAMTLWVYKMSVFSSMGALSACMTNPPALSASAAQTETDIPTLAYASVYPVALIFKVILAQLLVEILYRLL